MAADYKEILGFNDTARKNFQEGIKERLKQIYLWPLGNELLGKIAEKCSSTLNIFSTPFRFAEKEGCFRWNHVNKLFELDLGHFGATRSKPFEPTQLKVMQRKMEYIYLFHELVHFIITSTNGVIINRALTKKSERPDSTTI